MGLEYLWRKGFITIYLVYERIISFLEFRSGLFKRPTLNSVCESLINVECESADFYLRKFLGVRSESDQILKQIAREFKNGYLYDLEMNQPLVEGNILRLYSNYCKDPLSLFNLYQLSIVFGLYDAACIIRMSIPARYISGTLNVKRVLAKIEENCKLTENDRIYLKLSRPDLYYLHYQNSKNCLKDIDLSEELFYDMIRNKRVVVIGPLYENDLDITQYDTVVFIKNQSSTTIKKFNTLNKIYYFNSSNIRNNSFDSFYSIYGSDGYFCLKNVSTKHQKLTNVRTFRKNTSLLFGGPMMLQNIVYDLLLCSPKNIHITGFNFYQTKIFYNSEYHSTLWYNDLLFKRQSFSNHDLYSNFVFIKNIYSKGLISADTKTESFLKMSPSEYFNNLLCH